MYELAISPRPVSTPSVPLRVRVGVLGVLLSPTSSFNFLSSYRRSLSPIISGYSIERPTLADWGTPLSRRKFRAHVKPDSVCISLNGPGTNNLPIVTIVSAGWGYRPGPTPRPIRTVTSTVMGPLPPSPRVTIMAPHSFHGISTMMTCSPPPGH